MPEIVYGTPPGGGYRVDVPSGGGMDFGGGGMGGFGPGPDLSWIMDFAKQQAANKLRQQQLEMRSSAQAARAARDAATRARYSVREARPQRYTPDETLRQETIATEVAKQRAMRTPGPQRYIFGMGYAGGPNGLTPDVARMTPIQRQLNLPQGSGLMDSPMTRMETSGFRSDEVSDAERYTPNYLRMSNTMNPNSQRGSGLGTLGGRRR